MKTPAPPACVPSTQPEFAYVLNGDPANTVSMYTINSCTGSLTPTTPATIPTGVNSESMVVDPTEEKLREEFKDTKVLHLPMQCVVRIEEVEKRGNLSIRDAQNGEKIMPDVVRHFPMAPPRNIKD